MQRIADEAEAEAEEDVSPIPTHVGRGAGGLPRTIPLAPPAATTQSPAQAENDRGRRTMSVPLAPSMTGTRYGAALGGGAGGTGGPPLSPTMTGRQWGGGTPRCGRCGLAVYFAEQVKAVGKTWHKGCLRCAECGHTLDSGKVADKEGEPFCHRCYGKVSLAVAGFYVKAADCMRLIVAVRAAGERVCVVGQARWLSVRMELPRREETRLLMA